MVTMQSNLDRLLGNDWAGTLLQKLLRQKWLCSELMARCERQSEVIHADQSDELLKILDERQVLVDELTKLSGELALFREHWPELQIELTTAQQREIKELADSIQKMVQNVVEKDQIDEIAIQSEQNRVRAKIDNVQIGKISNAAYGQPVHRGYERRTNRFMDEQG